MKKLLALCTVLAAAFATQPALAQKKGGSGGSTSPGLTVQPWMSPEIGEAWNYNLKGQGATITVVDQFNSGSALAGNLAGKWERLRHGGWTLKQASLVAPLAAMRSQDFTSGARVELAGSGLNVLNLSYGMMGSAAYASQPMSWSAQETSIISHAKTGLAVISKSAGNDSVAVGSATSSGSFDYLNRDLVGAPSAIFVGALSTNGSERTPATLATYSNFAGSNTTVQNQFLVVGVEGSKTGLYGTSFAAPIVSGYAAILGSKFNSATPTQIANRLLTTARTDTISGYSASIHGRGEASLTRALAPVSVPQ